MCTALRVGWGIGQSWIEMGAWTGNKETKLESYINTDQSMNAVHWIHKQFYLKLFEKKNVFFLFCQCLLESVSELIAHCSWGIINCLGLFYKIRIDSERWRCIQTEHGLYNGKAIPPPPQNDILPLEKKENVVNSGTKVKRAAGGSDREALPYLWWTFILTFY